MPAELDVPIAMAPPAFAPREPAPAPPAPFLSPRARRRPSSGSVAAAMLVVALLAGAAAWAAFGSRGAPVDLPTGNEVVTVGDASVAVPPDWRPAQRPEAAVPDLGSPTAVLDPYPGMSLHAVVVLAPHGVPRALADLLGPLGTGRPTQLAGLPAVAYRERAVARDRIAELTVARTPAGDLMVACIARTVAWTAAAGCAEQIRSARTGS